MDELENQIKAASSKAARWANVGVVAQASENADTTVQSRAKWSKVYKLFGASGESQQDEVFAAVNAYFLRNGASPRGKYSKPIRTAGGVEVISGEVVKVTGKLEGEIRQFLRGRLEDSYMFLKHNEEIRNDEALQSTAQNAGVPHHQCWLLADWLGRDCPYFVGDESEVYNKLRTAKIQNAYDKQTAAQPAESTVRNYAPEAKVVQARGVEHKSYNQDLF